MVENGTISISNYSDTLKQQVVSEEEFAQKNNFYTSGWMKHNDERLVHRVAIGHVLRHQIGSWIILLSISSLQRGKPSGHEGPVGGLRKVSIYGVRLWVFMGV